MLAPSCQCYHKSTKKSTPNRSPLLYQSKKTAPPCSRDGHIYTRPFNHTRIYINPYATIYNTRGALPSLAPAHIYLRNLYNSPRLCHATPVKRLGNPRRAPHAIIHKTDEGGFVIGVSYPLHNFYSVYYGLPFAIKGYPPVNKNPLFVNNQPATLAPTLLYC